MDLFKFNPVTSPTVLENGEFINNAQRIMWVERYAEPGEFEIEAPLSSGLMDFLPLDTLISHVDTTEVMIVENHEISQEVEGDPTLKITGRSFVSYLENRFAGVNLVRSSSAITEYIIAAGYSWNQIVTLINDHIGTPATANDRLTNVLAQTSVSGTGISEMRSVSRADVLKCVMDLLPVDDLGIRTIRRNPFGIGSSTQTLLDIYAGVDRSDEVIFSWLGGDLDQANYLFSNKNNKNSALVFGQYVYRMVDTGPTNYARRMLIVDATDLDGHLSTAPTGSALVTLLAQMDIRGRTALKNQNNIAITQSDISKTTQYQYRRDYDIGDLITIDGNFNEMAVMRVVEYAEIEDENGESGHPTLALPPA